MITLVPDPWLAGIMDRPVHRVAVGPDGGDVLNAPRGFYYARIATDDVIAAHRLAALGFRVVDTGVTLEWRTEAGGTNASGVRHARPEDLEAVMGLARRGFSQSRFHLDPAIPKELADEIKSRWAGNFFSRSRGDHMIVAEAEGRVAGFLQLLDAADGALVIDLIAVDPAVRRRGLGRTMIGYASRLAKKPLMRVGTQVANTGSLRLYENLGFRTVASSYLMHLHG